jgi:hypothetical protein
VLPAVVQPREEHDDDDDDDDSNYYEWSDVGVALLVAAGWNTARPLVWEYSYTWRLFSLHVVVLLLAEEHNDDNNDDENDNDDDNDTSSYHGLKKQRQQHLQGWFGYQLLDQLLRVTRDESIDGPPITGRNNDNNNNSILHLHPLTPIGTLQLITNRIVAAATEATTTTTQQQCYYHCSRLHHFV